MNYHSSYSKIEILVKHNIPVLLIGGAGSGKTTLGEQVSENLKMKFHSISMTRQTTLSHLLGFLSVNGTYIPSTLRKCFEEGGFMLIDEIDAADPNVLLCLNTIENGYISFPDGLVKCHIDFRLVATANPADEHSIYTGRTKLDAATLDRYDIIDVERDDILEKTLVDSDTHNRMQLLREIMGRNNSSKKISMRDAIRYQQRKDLKLLDDDFVYRLTDKADLVLEQYLKEVDSIPKHQDQSECQTFEELSELLNVRAGGLPSKKADPQPEPQPEYEPDPGN